MKTTKGKLRNVTSGRLHTNIGDVYQFYTEYCGADGIMTHHIPSAFQALLPILKSKLSEEWFTDEWIKTGLDEPVEVPEMTQDEKDKFWESFGVYADEMWDSIKDKTIVIAP
jgi:hypothetical protein